MAKRVSDEQLREWLNLEFSVEEIAHLARPATVQDIQERLDALDKPKGKRKPHAFAHEQREANLQTARGVPVPRKRPVPPDALFEMEAVPFLPAPDVRDWLYAVFIDRGGDLTNDAHEHLLMAQIGVLWATERNQSKGRRVLGQAEKPFPRGDKWAKARILWHLEQTFGFLPDFVLTFDANYALTCDDWQWCALCEHELLHCAPLLDEDGCPRFDEETGKALFTIRGHDVEQFVDVVARYGARATGVQALVEAAQRGPEFADVDIEGACGTCLK